MKKYIAFILGFLPLLSWAQLVMSNNYDVVMSGGTSITPTKLVLSQSTPSGITNFGTGWIISENEFNMVDWYIGTSTGTYIIPFGDSTLQYLPLTFNISAAGVGAGDIKFSTYHTSSLNSSAKPSDVNNLTPFFLPGSPSNFDNSYNVADRFYIIDANTGYTTKPAAGNITFSYISGTAKSEVASPNTLTESRLMAQRYNSSTNTWNDWYGYGCTNGVISNVGTVQTGPVPAIDMYRSWSLWDNTMSLPITVTGVNATSGCINNGSASVIVYGGKSPYTYSWNPSVGTTATISGLSSGTYTITVRDANGCSSTGAVTVSQPSPLSVSDSIIANVVCNGGSTGNSVAHSVGGISPYTYSWSNGTSTVSTSNPTGAVLSAGTYTVTVLDHTGCSASSIAAISQPSAVRDSLASLTNPLCNGAKGSAAVGVKGGASPYSYSWTPNVSTTATATSLSIGNYTVTVTDNNGCSGTAISFAITQPTAIRDSIVTSSKVNETCNGGNTGSATAGVKGGASPYTYLWTPTSQTNATATGLSAGTYSVTVTDKNGCSGATATVTITQPVAIRDSMTSITEVKCNGGITGQAIVGVKYGTSPYTYSWSPNTCTTNHATGLSAGLYTLTITDNHGCSNTGGVTITQTAAIRDSLATITYPLCNLGTGSAAIGVAGGTSAYTYNWTRTLSTTATYTSLTAGTYTVAIKDNNGCSGTTVSIVITQPAGIRDSIVKASTVNVACNGGNTGSAIAGVKGGTSPYTYLWTPTSQTNATATGLSAGTYSLTVTDKNGCSGATATVTITQPATLLRDSVVSSICSGGSGTAIVGVKYGKSPYTYLWAPGGGTTATVTGLANGTYTITVTDANGCSFTTSTIVNCILDERVGTGDSCCPPSAGNRINLYPNPTIGEFRISGLEIGMLIEVYDYTGKRISLITATKNSEQINLSDQPNGVYLIRIFDKDGILLVSKKVVKTE